MRRFAVTRLSSSSRTDSSGATISRILYPSPEGEALPSGSSRDIQRLLDVEPASPPQSTVPEERLNSNETSWGLLRWLPKMKCNKDPAVDKPDQLSRKSSRSHPQSHSRSPMRVYAGPPRMAGDRRQRVSVSGTPGVYLTNLTRHPRERSLDRPQNTWFVAPQVSSQSLSFITHHRINHPLLRPRTPPAKDGALQNHRQAAWCVPFYLYYSLSRQLIFYRHIKRLMDLNLQLAATVERCVYRVSACTVRLMLDQH